MIVLGVDPGLQGALCLLVSDAQPFVADVLDMPLVEDGSKNAIDCGEIINWMRRGNYWPDEAAIENVQPMPSIPGKEGLRRSMGAASAFRFGIAVGELRGMLAALGIPRRPVHPQTWTRFYGLRGGDKEPHRQKALELFPECAELLRRKKDDGRAEAILIANWRHHQIRRGVFV